MRLTLSQMVVLDALADGREHATHRKVTCNGRVNGVAALNLVRLGLARARLDPKGVMWIGLTANGRRALLEARHP